MSNLLDKIGEQKKLSHVIAIQDRMDTDRDLFDLKEFELKDVDGNKIKNAIHINLNDCGVFAWTVESQLGAAVEQVVVESEERTFDTAYVESFIKAFFSQADALSRKRGEYLLIPFLDQQFCRRGRAAVRCYTQINEKGEISPDLTAWDTRFYYQEMGEDGLEWAAYEEDRTKEKILRVFPGIAVPGNRAVVTDGWSKTNNEIYIGPAESVSQPHAFGEVPVCYQEVPMGSMLADSDSLKYHGESILFLIRDLVPELCRLASIIQSLNQKALDNALLWKTDQGIRGKPPKSDDLTRPTTITAMGINEGVSVVPYGEIKNQATILHSMIETRIQRGSVSNLDLGIMGNQPWSAVSLIEIGEGRDQVFAPRLGSRGIEKQQLAEMFITQTLQICEERGIKTVYLGPRGHKREFDVEKLKGEYSVLFQYFIKSPKTDMARYAMGASVGGSISERTKREDIYQLQDPAEEDRRLRWEEAERLFPAIKMTRTLKMLAEAGEEDDDVAFEAEMAAQSIGINLAKILAGEVELPKPEEKEKPTQMISPFGGRSASGKKASMLTAEPRATEGEEE